MLAVIGALEEEVNLLREVLTGVSEESNAGILVATGDFRGTPVALARCGIGKVNAAICTQMLVTLYKPRALVFSGVAGGLLPNMQIGDLVIASHLIQFDIDLTAFGRRHGELPGRDRMIQSCPKLVEKTADAFDAAFEGEMSPNLMIGTVVSGDRFVEDSKTLSWLQREFGALATEMEGAAVGYTCQLNGVPFVVTRGLSDTANESAPTDFKDNLHKVCQNSFRLMDTLIPNLARDVLQTTAQAAVSA